MYDKLVDTDGAVLVDTRFVPNAPAAFVNQNGEIALIIPGGDGGDIFELSRKEAERLGTALLDAVADSYANEEPLTFGQQG
jgi:hypothetical protein